MIQNLNQVSFQGFGTILPERAQNPETSGLRDSLQILHPDTGETVIYQTELDAWLCPSSGTTILSVSKDNAVFRDYYLDKPVWIKTGVFFGLTALHGSSSVKVSADSQLQAVDTREHTGDFSLQRQLFVEQLYTFFYHEKELGFVFPGEAHPTYELTYVDQGSLHSVADGQDLLLEQGDMVLYAPGQWHMQHADVDVAPRYVTISFAVSGGDLSPLYNRKFKSPQKAVTLLQKMLREQERMDDYSGDMILCLLTQLLLSLLREADGTPEKLMASCSMHNENEIIRRALQYISSHIREKLSVPLVAKNIDISTSYLTALFHKHLQISPGEYIRRIKLQESKQLIREDSMNFTEIAAALQYSTVHHFSRQFKDKFGITPSEYAKSVR